MKVRRLVAPSMNPEISPVCDAQGAACIVPNIKYVDLDGFYRLVLDNRTVGRGGGNSELVATKVTEARQKGRRLSRSDVCYFVMIEAKMIFRSRNGDEKQAFFLLEVHLPCFWLHQSWRQGTVIALKSSG